MVVEIHLHTLLQRKTNSGMVRKITIELPPGSTLAEVLYKLDIDFPVDSLILLVNGRNADLKFQVNDKDIIHIIPALSGG